VATNWSITVWAYRWSKMSARKSHEVVFIYGRRRNEQMDGSSSSGRCMITMTVTIV